MTWEDGVKNFFSTYFAARRMWPIAYILGSPYSPLRAELEMPPKNWRDAFEDLLALENGRDMIREDIRKAEDDFTARKRVDVASFAIAKCNRDLIENEKLEARYRARREEAVKHKDHRIAQSITDDLLPYVKSMSERRIAYAGEVKAHYERYKDWTASRRRMRGRWIASLVDSGALPGWKWGMHNSIHGPIMAFKKRDSSPETEANIRFSELEMQHVFEEGQAHSFGSPALLPTRAIKALTNNTHTPKCQNLPNDPLQKFEPSKSSIVYQEGECDLVKMPDGSTGPAVKIRNVMVDGTIESKTFAQDPEGLFDETQGATDSMHRVHQAVKNYVGRSPRTSEASRKDFRGDESQEVRLDNGK
ncbi:MAG: hypothetical protein LQ337_008152 [Flavoplaca oasis]|nr:MAG: hypothetical protein LQ337_008152 [Flavoplaca oasis]